MNAVVSLMIVCVSYIGISSVLTLMLPYYLQDAHAPLPFAFKTAGLPAAALVVTVGALFGLSTSLLGEPSSTFTYIYLLHNINRVQ